MKWLVRAAAVLAAGAAHAQETSVESVFGSAFPGASITLENSRDYDEKVFFVGPFKSAYEPDAVLRLEGRVFEAIYAIPPNRSVLEVFRAYQRSMTGQGFTEAYSCVDDDGCGGNIGNVLYKRSLPNVQNRDDQRYGVFERTRGGVREVASVYVTKRGSSDPERQDVNVVLEALTTDAEEAELVTLNASAIASALESAGAAAIYGLEFATDSAELLPASKAVLDEMAAYLSAQPDAAILLVGHTDDQGALTYNMDLSKRRAAAVRQALIEDYGVAEARLSAHGVGYLAPKAANASEDGRAQNRRVEMVLAPAE